MSMNVYKSRNLEEIKRIEADIRELNECFQTLNNLVEQQGDQIQTIDDAIHESKESVQVASVELEKASEYNQSNNKLLMGAIVGGVISGIATSGLSLPYILGSLAGGALVGTFVGSKL